MNLMTYCLVENMYVIGLSFFFFVLNITILPKDIFASGNRPLSYEEEK